MKFNIEIALIFASSFLSNHIYAQSAKNSNLLIPTRTFYYPNNEWKLHKVNLEYLNTKFILDLKTLKDTNYVVILEGHTDDIGNAQFNMEISRKRVNHILEILTDKGISPKRVKISYFGKSKPEKRNIAISKKRSDIRYSNRRVVVKVQKQSDKAS